MNKLMEIYGSFRRLHIGTQVWMMLVLGPVIFLPLFAMNGPLGPSVAVLSVLGFAPAPLIIWQESGFSRKLAITHVIFWPLLLALVAWHFINQGFSGTPTDWIYVLSATVLGVSLIFDVQEVSKWKAGDRKVA